MFSELNCFLTQDFSEPLLRCGPQWRGSSNPLFLEGSVLFIIELFPKLQIWLLRLPLRPGRGTKIFVKSGYLFRKPRSTELAQSVPKKCLFVLFSSPKMEISFLGLGSILSSSLRKKKKKDEVCVARMYVCARGKFSRNFWYGVRDETPEDERLLSVGQMALKVVWGVSLARG